MARLIEIAGLGDAVKGIKRDIADIKSVAKDINEEAPKLKAELMDLRDQIKEHRADISAEAGAMGNSGDNSEKQVVTTGDVGKIDAIVPLPTGSVGVTEPGA